MPSPTGWHEVPCVECDKSTAGIDFGERCDGCLKRRKKRAGRLARRSALVATLIAGAWVVFDVPTSEFGQLYAAMSIPVTYLLVHMIVGRFAMELMP
jgi:hypothetical protein